MKLIIDIPEEDREDICNIHFIREDLKFKVGGVIMHGTPFDSVIEDIKTEIETLQSDTNVMMYSLAISDVLEIIDKHISGKETDEQMG